MNRAGFTLVETLVAATLSTVLLGGVWAFLGGGNQLFTRGLEVAQGRQAALLFFEQLEDDLAGCILVPGQNAKPVAISEDGHTVAFYRTNRSASTLQVAVCTPVDWSLPEPADKKSERHPVRNGLPLKHVAMREVRYELVEPDFEHNRPAWMLSVEGRFPEGGVTGRVVTVKRLLELVQPTSIARYGFGEFVDDVPALSFVMLEGTAPVRKLLARAGLGAGAGPQPPPPAVDATPPTTATTGVSI